MAFEVTQKPCTCPLPFGSTPGLVSIGSQFGGTGGGVADDLGSTHFISGMNTPRVSSRPCATTLPPEATRSCIVFSRQLRRKTSASWRFLNSVSIA